MLIERFAKNMKRIRAKKGLTQYDVSEAARYSLSYASMLERGLRSPSLEVIQATADALGVDPLALLRG